MSIRGVANRMTRAFPGAARRREAGGFILVAVLWILAALATLATIFSVYLANTAVSLSLGDGDIQTDALLTAGLELTAYQVAKPSAAQAAAGQGAAGQGGAVQGGAGQPAQPGPPQDGQLTGAARLADLPPPARGDFGFRLGRARVEASFVAETARIDINTAQPRLLANFFVVLGAPPALAARYVQRIAGWITPPNSEQQTAFAAEDALYRSAGLKYGPRGAPFTHLDELSLVAEIPPALIERAKPFLTVYSRKTEIDVLDAAPEVVAAIPGLTPALMQALAQARLSGADQRALDRLLGALPLSGVVSIAGGDTYRVQVRIRYDNGRRAAAEAVIRTGGAGDKPYNVLWWRGGGDALADMGPVPGPRLR